MDVYDGETKQKSSTQNLDDYITTTCTEAQRLCLEGFPDMIRKLQDIQTKLMASETSDLDGKDNHSSERLSRLIPLFMVIYAEAMRHASQVGSWVSYLVYKDRGLFPDNTKQNGTSTDEITPSSKDDVSSRPEYITDVLNETKTDVETFADATDVYLKNMVGFQAEQGEVLAMAEKEHYTAQARAAILQMKMKTVYAEIEASLHDMSRFYVQLHAVVSNNRHIFTVPVAADGSVETKIEI